MIFELDNTDISIHKALAASMEMGTLQSVVQSISDEHRDLSKSLGETELSNHITLLGIYADELLLRLNSNNPQQAKYLH